MEKKKKKIALKKDGILEKKNPKELYSDVEISDEEISDEEIAVI